LIFAPDLTKWYKFFYNVPLFSNVVPMIQQLEATLKSGGVPQGPQFKPDMPVKGPSQTAGTNANQNSTANINGTGKTKREDEKTKSQDLDPLDDARKMVQQEIMKEFTAIMASGTIRASEAAALATRRVMQKHGH
jgi:desumoylating isopeptidase 1